MSFVPVELSQSHRIIGQPNECDAFEFTPTACAELANQSGNLPDAVTGRDRFYDFDAANDFKILRHVPYCTFAFARMNSSTSFFNRACALRSM